MDAIDTITVACMGAYGLLLAVTITLIFVRRHIQPLKVRDPYILVAANISAYIGCGSVVPYFNRNFSNCLANELFQPAFIVFYVLVLARFWRLFLASYLTHARLSGDLNVWILRHPWVASSRTIWACSALLAGAITLLHFWAARTSTGCSVSSTVEILDSVLSLVWSVIVVFMTYKLREIRDGFFITTELKMLGTWIMAAFIVIIVFIETDMTGFRFVMIGVSIGHMAIQMWYPLYKSFQMQRQEHRRARQLSSHIRDDHSPAPLNANSDLLQILQHPDGFLALKRFLTLEFSVENLLLWEQLYRYRDEKQPDKIAAHFRHIYDIYVRDQSPNQVNISSQLKVQFGYVAQGLYNHPSLILMCESPSHQPRLDRSGYQIDIMQSLLQHLYLDIVELMREDSFRRFKQSDQYQDMLRIAQLRLSII